MPHAVVRRTWSRGKCRDSRGHDYADCEVRGVFSFLQVDEILGYLAEEASSRVELCCTTMHVRILPGRHKPCCVCNCIDTVGLFQLPKMEENVASKRFANDEDLKDAGWITRRPHVMKRVYTNWCQCTCVLISKATMWKVDKGMCHILYVQFLYGETFFALWTALLKVTPYNFLTLIFL